MEPGSSEIEAALDTWLAPFLEVIGRKTRRRWAPLYLHGLLGPDGRKSLQPLAARLGLGGHDQLQHFIASPAWDDAPLRAVLAGKADALVGGPSAVLVIDDTALPKKGKRSVGVARQYCGALGKQANCQVLVSLTLAQDEVPVPLGLRLFLPDEWASDPDRCADAGVPEEHRRALAKTEIALAEIDRVAAAGVRFGRALADAGYGMGAAFRQGLSARGLAWAVGVLKTQNVYAPTVELHWPTAPTGRPRRHPVPSEAPAAAEAVLARAEWHRISWRQGTKGPLAAEFAAVRVRPAEGAQLRNGWHLPGDEVWLVGERRSSGEQKYYLSNLPADTPLDELAATIKARWVCEQAHQQLKEELGLDHFEGRSWIGLHRHALMTMIAFAFLQHLRLEQAGRRGKKRPSPGRSTAATHPAGGSAHAGGAALAGPGLLPPLRRPPQTGATQQSAQVVLGSAGCREARDGWRATERVEEQVRFPPDLARGGGDAAARLGR
ncbi:MAG TPA: IS701 family transposase, partial [Actinomycetes bacterium]|nr:IS701 family transposase [Actinomycetes bacterium]